MNPDREDKSLLIVDIDGPEAIVQTKARYVSHRRLNFKEHVVFNYFKETPERASRKTLWSTSMDIGMEAGIQGDPALAIRTAPNTDEKAEINVVLVDKHLKSLDLNIPKAELTTALTNANDKKIPRGKVKFVNVTGKNIIGEFVLRKAGGMSYACNEVAYERVLKADYANTTKVVVLFK